MDERLQALKTLWFEGNRSDRSRPRWVLNSLKVGLTPDHVVRWACTVRIGRAFHFVEGYGLDADAAALDMLEQLEAIWQSTANQ